MTHFCPLVAGFLLGVACLLGVRVSPMSNTSSSREATPHSSLEEAAVSLDTAADRRRSQTYLDLHLADAFIQSDLQ